MPLGPEPYTTSWDLTRRPIAGIFVGDFSGSLDVSRGGGVDWSMQPPGSRQYFLVENRQKISYDAGLPGCGILVWHIDESSAGNGNDARRLVGLAQADGRNDLNPPYGQAGNSGDAGDVFAGRVHESSFDAASKPSSNLNGGAASGVTLTRLGAACGSAALTLNVKMAGAAK